jgi:hypothetical protein
MGQTILRVGWFALIGLAGAVTASATDPVEPNGSTPAWTGVTTHPPVWVNNAMPTSVERKLGVAFELAVRRLRNVPTCAALFDDLDVGGVRALSQTLYFPVPLWREQSLCRGALAATVVGRRPVLVCRDFAHLSDSHAAMLLIHEALHAAGLTERPSDRHAMSGAAINRMVVEACRLERGLTFEQAVARRNGP